MAFKIKIFRTPSKKAFVPQMPDINSIFATGLDHNEYKTMDSQLKQNTGWVYLASDTISERCSSVHLKLMEIDADGNEIEVFHHEILDLLRNPTSVMTAKQMWKLYYDYMNLVGEAYILKLGRDGKPLADTSKLPSALSILPSNLCCFKLGATWLESYIELGAERIPITALIRSINPDPENMYRGMSIVRKASLTIDTDQEMRKWNSKFFKNSARPSVAVEVPTELSQDGYLRLKQSFQENYTGTDNAFNSIILENGAKVQPFMMSQQDLDFLQSRKFHRDEILSMFKVSPSNVGIVENVNRANAEAQKAEFAERCVVPRLEQLCDVINQQMIQKIYGQKYRLTYENPVEEDQDRKLALANNGVNKWFSIDEVREMYGYEPLPNGLGQEIYSQISNIPISELSIVGSLNGSTTNDTAETVSTPVQEPETPTNANNEATEPKSLCGCGHCEAIEQKEAETTTKSVETRYEIGEAKVKRYIRKSLAYEKLIQRLMRKMFDKQKTGTIAWLKSHEKANRNYIKKDWSGQIIAWDEYKTALTTDLMTIFQMIIKEVGTEAFAQFIREDNFNPRSTAILKIIEEEAMRASTEINDETQKQLKATLAEGMQNKESLNELTARVNHIFGTTASYRARMTAQTESAMMLNTADVQAWKQTGVVHGKEWYTAEDEQVCGFCNEMDGIVLDLDGVFLPKGDISEFVDGNGNTHKMKIGYRDINVPPLHPNCRCVLLPVVER